jgi:hypothetical protein
MKIVTQKQQQEVIHPNEISQKKKMLKRSFTQGSAFHIEILDLFIFKHLTSGSHPKIYQMLSHLLEYSKYKQNPKLSASFSF